MIKVSPFRGIAVVFLIMSFLISHGQKDGPMKAPSDVIVSGENVTDQEKGAYAIVEQADHVVLSAGILQRRLYVSKAGVFTQRLSVDGRPLISEETDEVSFRIFRAEPNRYPEAERVKGNGEKSSDPLVSAEYNAKDWEHIAEIDGLKNEVEWVDGRKFSGRNWSNCFNHLNTEIYQPSTGVTRLVVRARSLGDETLDGVSVNLVYEIYDGYPVIRKWFEIRNNSASWIKIDSLTLDDIQLASEYRHPTPLTPGERGAGPSIMAFSNQEQTHGLIVASEVPSALRRIEDDGSSGYAPHYFEWVMGPAEHFVSEPTFTYAFSGEVFETISARSLPMDRAVESGFNRFLHDHLNISPPHIEIPAPEWATWTNFGPKINEAIVREQAEIAAKCGFKMIELDDGWQRGRLGIEPHPEKFPRMVETAGYIRSLGLRLGLWVSSFRMPDEKDFQALPDAAINPEVKRLKGLAMSFSGPWSEYLANDLVFLHDYYGATYFKQDFTNIKYGDLGAGTNARTRKESLLRGLRGLFEAQDILRSQAPSVANQITHEIYWGTPGVPADLAVLKHAFLYHIPPNDYSGVGHWKKRAGQGDVWDRYDPQKLREDLIKGCYNARKRFYAHRGLPLECIEYYAAATVNWKGSLTPAVQDRQVCSWLMGAPLLFAGDLTSLTEESIAHYRKRFDEIERLQKEYNIFRHFQYSGVPAPTDKGWHWWGKLNEQDEGAVVVIRGKEGSSEQKINIPWVKRDREYTVRTLFSGDQPRQYSGAALQDGQLKLKLPRLGQEILEVTR